MTLLIFYVFIIRRFGIFLFSQDRSGELWVDEKQAHKMPALRCLNVMYGKLRKDICQMRAPGALASQVDKTYLVKCLPSEIQHACLY
jgi:hypothetical protein